MPVSHYERRSTADEIALEMDRRGDVIIALETKLQAYLDALENIDAVGVDFGHFEAAARTMQDIARKALGYAS